MSSHWSRCLAQCPLSALGPRPRKCQAGRGRGLSTMQPQVTRLQSPCLGKVLGSRGGGRSELRGRPVHHSPSTHRAVQNPLPVPCPCSHPRCLRSAYCPSSRTWSVRPAPPRLSASSGQWHHVTLTDPPSLWHTREGRGGAEGTRGRCGASAVWAVPGPPRGRRRKQPRLGRQDQACGPRSGTLRE